DLGHVVGGWSGHISLTIGGRCKQQLQQLGATYIKTLCSSEIDVAGAQVIEEPHISLTRTFYLQEHQIANFMEALEEQLQAHEFTVGFGKPIFLVNEQRDRGFVAMQVDRGNEGVQRMVEMVNVVMRRFGKEEFYQDARFHASVVKMDMNCRLQRMREIVAMLGCHEEIMSTRIDIVECIFGNRRFCIALKN
ncbi:hypothetical protein IWW36_003076, partial [Coemansia brasiliensis]